MKNPVKVTKYFPAKLYSLTFNITFFINFASFSSMFLFLVIFHNFLNFSLQSASNLLRYKNCCVKRRMYCWRKFPHWTLGNIRWTTSSNVTMKERRRCRQTSTTWRRRMWWSAKQQNVISAKLSRLEHSVKRWPSKMKRCTSSTTR